MQNKLADMQAALLAVETWKEQAMKENYTVVEDSYGNVVDITPNAAQVPSTATDALGGLLSGQIGGNFPNFGGGVPGAGGGNPGGRKNPGAGGKGGGGGNPGAGKGGKKSDASPQFGAGATTQQTADQAKKDAIRKGRGEITE